MSAADGKWPRRIAFVTGKLAEPLLRRTVAELERQHGFEAEICVLKISVAALMTTEWVARHLTLSRPVDLVLLPGLCRGSPDVVRQRLGVPVEKGPKEIWQLPEYFGQQAKQPEGYGGYDIEIIAEINHCPRLTWPEIEREARELRAQGADVIDIGCEPGQQWGGLGDCVRRLRDLGLRVSVDTLDPEEAAEGVRAGAELVLSVHEGTARHAIDWGCEVVVIPAQPGDWASLERAISYLEKHGVSYRIDPILEPIGFGFAASLLRYAEARRRWPEAPLLMGVGNVTELTDVDSAGVNVLLAAICQELGIRSVLTTRVINWCRTAVRELDVARRLVWYAVRHGTLPKRLDSRLIMLRDPERVEPGESFLREVAERVRDKNFRLFAARGKLHAINRSGHRVDEDPFALFRQLMAGESIDPAHAFYLGYELCKAELALRLGKQYVQDEPLRWGVAWDATDSTGPKHKHDSA